MVYRLLRSPEMADTSILRTINDGASVPSDDPVYRKAVAYLVSRGLIKPYEDNTLKVNSEITRAEQLALLDAAGKVLEEREELKEDLVTSVTPPSEAKPIYPETLPGEAPVRNPEPAPAANEEAAPQPTQATEGRGYYEGEEPTPTIDPNSAHGKRGWKAPLAPETRGGHVYYGELYQRVEPQTEPPAEAPTETPTTAPTEAPATAAPTETSATAAPTETPATASAEPAAEAPTEAPAEEPQVEPASEAPAAEAAPDSVEASPAADESAATESPEDKLSAEGFEKAFRARKITGEVSLAEDYELEDDKALKKGSTLLLSENVTLEVPAGRTFEIEPGAEARGALGSKISVRSGGELDIWDSGFNFAQTGIVYEIESGGTVRVDGNILIGSNANATLSLVDGTLSLKDGVYELLDAELEINKDYTIRNGESAALLGSSLIVVKANLLFENGALISAASRDSNIIIKNGSSLTGLPEPYDFSNPGVYYFNVRDGEWLQIK
jgi:hypothetical protein